MPSKPVIVLTPGAWHSPAHFETFEAELRRRGYETAATTNVSVGSEPPTKGLAEDVASARAVVEGLVEGGGRHVVVVAHSYGGIVTAGSVKGLSQTERAREGKAGGVVAVLYIAAFVAQEGESVFSKTSDEVVPWLRVEVRSLFLYPPPPPPPSLETVRIPELTRTETPNQEDKGFVTDPVDVFYGDVPPEVAAKAVSLLRHMPTKAFEAVVPHEPWHDVPCCGYLVCEDDKAIPVAAQQAMAGLLGPEALVVALKSSHSPFLSMPGETADVVERLAEKAVEAVGA